MLEEPTEPAACARPLARIGPPCAAPMAASPEAVLPCASGPWGWEFYGILPMGTCFPWGAPPVGRGSDRDSEASLACPPVAVPLLGFLSRAFNSGLCLLLVHTISVAWKASHVPGRGGFPRFWRGPILMRLLAPFSSSGITRSSLHKRRATGGKRKHWRKARK